MTINQLFTKKPSKELIEKLISSFGLTGFSDDKVFSKRDIDKYSSIQKIKEFKDELSVCYLPCKRKIYIEDLTIKKSITILRQILKLYDHVVKSNERWIKGEKIIVYQILPKNQLKKTITNNDKCIISFD